MDSRFSAASIDFPFRQFSALADNRLQPNRPRFDFLLVVFLRRTEEKEPRCLRILGWRVVARALLREHHTKRARV
jgi:hypothetical protein